MLSISVKNSSYSFDENLSAEYKTTVADFPFDLHNVKIILR